MSEQKREVPQKFKKVDSSFVNRLYNTARGGAFTKFSLFPQKMHFYSKDPGEEVVLVARTHWIAYVPQLFVAFLFLFLPLIFTLLSSTIKASIPTPFYVTLFILGGLLALNILVTTIVSWYYSVLVITDLRIVVVELRNAFFHSYSEARLEKIEDVTHSNIGIIGNIFDVGNLDIDTAGHEIDFRIKFLPKPRELQDAISDLAEMKKKGKI